jgi:hypothetical protein
MGTDAIRIPSLRMTELDGSPDVQGVERIYLTSGYMSSLGSGNVLLSLSGSGGAGSPVTIRDIDGVPSIANLSTLYVTNGFLSDLGSGNALLSMSGSAGGGAPVDAEYWVETANGTLSNEVVVGTTGITTAAYASRQAAAKAGRLFLPSNGFVIERDTGSAWGPWGPVFPFVAPINADFSDFNSPSITTTNGGVFLSIPASASSSLRGRDKATPTVPYTITAAFLLNLIAANTIDTLGLVFSDGTKYASFGVGYNTGVDGGYYLLSGKWNTATSYSANYTATPFSQFGSVVWLRIADNNTNRVCSISGDGVNFITFHSIGRTDFLTATRVGWGGSVANASNAAGATLLSWREE